MPPSSRASLPVCAGHGLGDLREAHRAGVPVDQRDAVDEEAGAERAEQEVLHRRLLAEQPPAPGQSAEQVEREREHLERHEHGQQVVGRREHQHARRPRTSSAGRPRCARGPWSRPRARPRCRGAQRPARRRRVTPPSRCRSAKSSTLSTASTRTSSQQNSAGPSTASAPIATTLPRLRGRRRPGSGRPKTIDGGDERGDQADQREHDLDDVAAAAAGRTPRRARRARRRRGRSGSARP